MEQPMALADIGETWLLGALGLSGAISGGRAAQAGGNPRRCGLGCSGCVAPRGGARSQIVVDAVEELVRRQRREHTVHKAGIIAPRVAGRKDARRAMVWIDDAELIMRGLLHCIGKQDRHSTRADGLAHLVEWDVGPAMGVLRQQHARGVARRPA